MRCPRIGRSLLGQPPCFRIKWGIHHDQFRSSGGAGRRCDHRRDAGGGRSRACHPGRQGPASNIVKPLTLAATRDLHFGTIVVTGDDSVSINQAGTVTCGAAANVTCDTHRRPVGPVPCHRLQQPAGEDQRFTGSNLANGAATLAFTPSAPANVTLPNSGASGRRLQRRRHDCGAGFGARRPLRRRHQRHRRILIVAG